MADEPPTVGKRRSTLPAFGLPAAVIRFEADIPAGLEVTIGVIAERTDRYNALIVETYEGFAIADLVIAGESQFAVSGSPVPAEAFAPHEQQILLSFGTRHAPGILEGQSVELTARNTSREDRLFCAKLTVLPGPTRS